MAFFSIAVVLLVALVLPGTGVEGLLTPTLHLRGARPLLTPAGWPRASVQPKTEPGPGSPPGSGTPPTTAMTGAARASPLDRLQRRLPFFLPPSPQTEATPDAAPSLGAAQSEQKFLLRPFAIHRTGAFGVLVYCGALVILAVLSIFLLYLSPRRGRRMKEALRRGWRQLIRLSLIGFLAGATVLVSALILTLVVVGIPLAALLMVVLALVTIWGLVGVALALGETLAQWLRVSASSPLFFLALGLPIIFSMSILPLIGWPFFGVVAALGLGSLVVTKFGSGEPWSLAPFDD